MSHPPAQPKIYHITHVENLPAILEDAGLLCDRAMLERGGPQQTIGMGSIKQRRVEQLAVSCHPETKVGDYVPFYFCPRSIMLFVIHRANHPELAYSGGQRPIVHLQADLHVVIDWAIANGRRWAFSLSNAGASYTQFRSSREELDQLDWNAIAATDFRRAEVKEGKQAEFLLHGTFPWDLVEKIGVQSRGTRDLAASGLVGAAHRPPIAIEPGWYY